MQSKSPSPMTHPSLLASALAIAGAPAASLADCPATWPQAIQGTYVLQEWHARGEVLRSPAVEGRFTLQDRQVITVLMDNARADEHVTRAQFGEFRTEGCRFAYRYTRALTVNETSQGVTTSPTLPWEGMREFEVSGDGAVILMRSSDGPREFRFDADELRYSEKGALLRVWRKARTP